MTRKFEITYARAIFCILVVLIHAFTEFLNDTEPTAFSHNIAAFLRILLLFATPCFIILSELLLAMRYTDQLPKHFFLKRLKFIVIPYIIIGTFDAYSHYLDNINDTTFKASFFSTVLYGDWYGWFVFVILQFYVLHALLKNVLNKAKPSTMLGISFVISATHATLMHFSSGYTSLMDDIYPFFHRTFILYWLFYFVFGFYLGKYYDQVIQFIRETKLWLLCIWFACIMLIYINYNYFDSTYAQSNRFDLLVYTVLSFMLIIYILWWFRHAHIPFLLIISEISFFIYLTHRLLISYISRALSPFILHPWIYFVLLVIFTLSFSIGLALILSFIPYSKFVVGRNSFHTMIHRHFAP